MKLNDSPDRPQPETEHGRDVRVFAIPDVHGHCKGEHKPYAEERPLPLTSRMLFLWFYHACRRGWPRFMMVSDHMNYLTFEDPAAVNLVRRALKLAQAGDLLGAAETANVDVAHAAVVSEGLRRGMRFSIGAEVDNDPRSRPDAQNIVDAMRPDGMIRSVHFIAITHPQHGDGWNWAFDNPEFVSLYEHVGAEKTWELYMATLLDAVERLPGHIVGHFYVPATFGHWPDDATLERYEDQLLEKCAERGMAVEFNTRFLYRGEDDPQRGKMLDAYRRLLRKAHERGVQIAIGADAHSPRDQSNGFEIVLQVLDELGINELAFPLQGRLARVALKVERKPEPEPAPPPPPVVAAVPDEAEAAQIVPTVSGESVEKPSRPSRAKKPKAAEAPAERAETSAPETVAAPPADALDGPGPAVALPETLAATEPPAKPARAKKATTVAATPVEEPPALPAVQEGAALVPVAPSVAKPVKPKAKPSTLVTAVVSAVKTVAAIATKPVAKAVRAKPAAKPAPRAAATVKPAAAPAKKAAAPAKKAAKPAAKAKAAAKPPARKAAPPARKAAAPAKRTAAKAAPKRAAAKPAAKAKPAARTAKAKAPARPAPRAKAAPKKVTAKAKPAARATARPKPATAKRKATKRR